MSIGCGDERTGSGAVASVDLGAVGHNVRVLQQFAGEAAVMAVLKADGYNHGAIEVAHAAVAAGVQEIGVTTIGEALELRAAGIGVPVLAWLHRTDSDYDAAITAQVGIGVSTAAQLDAVVAAARRVGRAADLSLKIDTGLNRNGVAEADLDVVLDATAAAVAEGAVRLVGMFSHLACSDEPSHPANDAQAERLRDAVSRASRRGTPPAVVHLSNSAATLTRPDLCFDMVRPGIALYGLSPVPDLGTFGLRPVMTLSAQVANIKKVSKGESVSYGYTWTAPADTVVALIALGYADGVVRRLSGRFEVTIAGRRFPSVGRVCMDQFVVDLGGDGSGVAVGDEALLFGPGARGEAHAQDWADALDTISYEVVTGIRGRVRRQFVGARSGEATE
ncbi:alanine racemase [Rhodococcus yunnanensis]|uniref:Alanine racemase n=1 Tax=Rhodococcoides yunnanense TaxID=278209 RepID=A0ABU4BGQ8_9NOCA|nr:alanine racemase [Rhodococcus yunnanensis]MDV6263382.1 alanine racemase [Rhodococcus yunnanensis]